MLNHNTPIHNYMRDYGLLVKREDLSCPPPGPPFSKTRGVYAHIKNRPEKVIGVLDTYHSQAGHAVAQACSVLGKRAVNFYPVRKSEVFDTLKPQQQKAMDLGAILRPLQAGRSAILFHQAKKELIADFADCYMMPNALKLPEMVTETATEAYNAWKHVQHGAQYGVYPMPQSILIAISSGTIAAGVIKGVTERCEKSGMLPPRFVLHQGYSRPHDATIEYIMKMSNCSPAMYPGWVLVDEKYSYGDVAKLGVVPQWPCNQYYDLKAFRWWVKEGREQYGSALLWNIG